VPINSATPTGVIEATLMVSTSKDATLEDAWRNVVLIGSPGNSPLDSCAAGAGESLAQTRFPALCSTLANALPDGPIAIDP